MKIKITKTMRYADSAPHMPQVQTTKGDELEVGVDVSDHIAGAVLASGCGEEIKEEKKEQKPAAKKPAANKTNKGKK